MNGYGNAPLGVWYDNGVVRRPRIEGKVSWVIPIVSRNGIWKPAAWVIVAIKHVPDTVSGLRSPQTCPENLKGQEISSSARCIHTKKKREGPGYSQQSHLDYQSRVRH